MGASAGIDNLLALADGNSSRAANPLGAAPGRAAGFDSQTGLATLAGTRPLD